MEREELLKSAKALYEYHFTSDKLKYELEDAFPELKKSEDERIREDMVTYLRNELHNITQPTPRTNEVERWITYLENQPTNEEMLRILRAEYEKGVADTILKYEQKPIFRIGDTIIAKDGTCIPKEPFHIESIEDGCYWDGDGSILVCNQDDFQLIGQQPSEDSDDKRIRKALIHLINEQNGFLTVIDGISVKDIIAYLEKQQERKPTDWSEEEIKKIRSEEYTRGFNDAAFGGKLKEWSEEDKVIFIANYEYFSKEFLNQERKDIGCPSYGARNDFEEEVSWLKSLPERATNSSNTLTWKDINDLERIINNVHYEFRNGIGEKSFGEEVLERFREERDE